jgi:hypothetical protein
VKTANEEETRQKKKTKTAFNERKENELKKTVAHLTIPIAGP